MQSDSIQHVVIAGGGTAGWMAAAAMARLCANGVTRVTLIESDEIGIVGVGEATIPPIKTFNGIVGIDENDFLASTEGTFKVGIEFDGWQLPGRSYMHPFGAFGSDINGVRFHQFWLKQRIAGSEISLGDYSLSNVAGKMNKFVRPTKDPASVLSTMDYAFHFDAGLYAKYLSKLSQARGVRRIEGKICSVEQRDDGYISAIVMDGGLRIEGDLYIDCTGFRGLLIEQALKTGYEDWTHYLPCNRAVAVPSQRTEPLLPYTRASARQAGWQWRIPLQHRTGNGHVYCNQFISDDEAISVLLSNLDGQALAEPRVIPFTTGRRKLAWNKNCIALGLAAGFMEPLESTSIHLIQAGVSKLMSLFPTQRFEPMERDEYNRLTQIQWEQIRDFLITHYRLNQRAEPFWRQCAQMAIPESLQRKLDLFSRSGHLFRYSDELFAETSWIAVLIGQGLMPVHYDPLVDTMSEQDMQRMLMAMVTTFRNSAHNMPLHSEFIRQQCLHKPN